MSVPDVLNVVGAVGTIGMGCLGLFAPNQASKFTGLAAANKTAFAEFRATFGGSFVLMGAIPLITDNTWAYFMAGMFWAGASGGRLISIVLDKGHREPKNVGGVFFEGAFALLLLAGSSLFQLG
jgi:Domain of unknown function (DUF4345)